MVQPATFLRVASVSALGYLSPMDSDQHTKEETEQRLQKILQGAFSGPPTPLKAIPKRNGEFRSVNRAKKQRRKRKT